MKNRIENDYDIEDVSESINVENELIRSEAQYKELFNNANDAIFFGQANEEGMPINFIGVNERACKLLGYLKDEILKISPLQICNSKDYIEKFLNKYDNKLTSNRATYETVIKAKDRVCIPAEVSVDIFKLNGNNVFLTVARDITEKKKLENILKESEERYRQIVNLLPDAIIITVDGKIVLANKEACKYFNNLVGESVYKFAPDFEHVMKKRIDQIVKNKQIKTVFDYKIPLDDNTVIHVEVSSSYLDFQGKPAILSIMREITKRKRELNSAAKMQRKLFKKPFTIPNKVKIETLYVPARTVSGDFLYLCKKNKNLLIGIIGDVCGKGITAALNISAFNVLFHEAALISYDPSEILNNLNRKVSDYLSEKYIAACCFSFDFENNEVKVVGAGINQFIYQNSFTSCQRKIVKGPFLGMFEDSVFDEQIIQFNSGDRFYFFTDGLDFVFDDEKICDVLLEVPTINKFTKGLKTSLNEMLTDVDGIQDDCTLISMEIR